MHRTDNFSVKSNSTPTIHWHLLAHDDIVKDLNDAVESHLNTSAPPLDAVLSRITVPSTVTTDDCSAYMAPPNPPQKLDSKEESLAIARLAAVNQIPPPCIWALFSLINILPSRVNKESAAYIAPP